MRLFGLQDSRTHVTGGSRRNSTAKNARSASVLFDDDTKQLLVADMGIDDHSPIGKEIADDGADFGTAFRQTMVSKESRCSIETPLTSGIVYEV